MVSELLVKNIARKGDMPSVDTDVIRMLLTFWFMVGLLTATNFDASNRSCTVS